MALMKDRQIFLGRLRFPAAMDDIQEGIGGTIDSQGSFVTLGERQPKQSSLDLAIHGLSSDPDEREYGERLRRQVRAAFNNERLRGCGFWLYSDLDPQLTGWYFVGSGTLTYDDGNITFGEHKLALSDTVRVGTPRTHRAARRLLLKDLGSSLNTVDYLGRRNGAVYSSIAGAGAVVLPVAATDVVGGPTVANNRARYSKAGRMTVLDSRVTNEVLSYEQPIPKVGAGDVALYDRKGLGNDNLYHPYGQRSTIAANVFPNPFPRRDLVGWQTAYFLANTAAISFSAAGGPTHGSPGVAQGYARATCDGTAVNQGIEQRSVPGFTFVRGRTYRFSGRCCRFSGTLNMQIRAGDQSGVGGFASASFAPAGTWDAVYSVDWTPTGDASSNSVSMAITTNGVVAADFGVAHFAVMDITEIPAAQCPTHALYNDGEQPGCCWMGQPDYSGTVCHGRTNLVFNPQFEGETGLGMGSGSASGVTWGNTAGLARRRSQPWGIAVAYASGTDPYWKINSSTIRSERDQVPDQSFRFQGQRMCASVYSYINQGTGPSPALTAGVTDKQFSAVDAAGVTTSSKMTDAVANVNAWSRLSLPLTPSASAYSAGIELRLYNGLANAVQVRYTEMQLEFSLDGRPTEFFSGHDRDCMYVSASKDYNGYSVEDDPERSHGWEQVFGDDQELTTFDMPVMSNGLCRVRMVTGATSQVFAVDTWTLTGGWQEQGRWVPYRSVAAGMDLYYCFTDALQQRLQNVGSVSVVELSQDQATLRVSMIQPSLTNNAADVYITLRRGWTGPRIEMYNTTSEAVALGTALKWVPAPLGSRLTEVGQAVMTGGLTTWVADSNVDSWTGVGHVWSSAEAPLLQLGRQATDTVVNPGSRKRPMGFKVANFMPLQQGTAVFGDANADAYASYSTMRGLAFVAQYSGSVGGYVGVQQGFVEQGYETNSNASDGSVVEFDAQDFFYPGQGAKLSGTDFVETQVALTNPALGVPGGYDGILRPGSYQVWVHARSTTSAGVGRGYSGSQSTPAPVTIPVSGSLSWICLGKLDIVFASDSGLVYFGTAGGGTVHCDKVCFFPVERRLLYTGSDAYDGGTDMVQMTLYDEFTEPMVVRR